MFGRLSFLLPLSSLVSLPSSPLALVYELGAEEFPTQYIFYPVREEVEEFPTKFAKQL
jgi:hypothetical protein